MLALRADNLNQSTYKK